MVDLNITLWIQLANFLVTLVVLNYLLISPIRKIIRKRKDNVEGLIGEIEAFTAEKQQLLDEYESELRKAREAAAIYRKDGKVMGELERARIFDAASKDAQSEVRTTQAAVRRRRCDPPCASGENARIHRSRHGEASGITQSSGDPLKALASFFLSRDGIVAVATLILLGVVSHFSDPYNPWINLLARVGNVCVFLYILWRAAGKAIVDGLSDRRAAIVDELDSLAVRKAAAEEQLAAMIEKIDSLDAECETILKDSRARGEAIREALVADALEEAEKIRNAAHRAADSETKKAIEELRSQMADEIVQAVEATLKEKLDMKKHVKLIDNALKKVVLN